MWIAAFGHQPVHTSIGEVFEDGAEIERVTGVDDGGDVVEVASDFSATGVVV